MRPNKHGIRKNATVTPSPNTALRSAEHVRSLTMFPKTGRCYVLQRKPDRTRYNVKLYLHVCLPCPREMGNAHFSNVKPVPERSTEIYSLPSEIKTHTNTIQFKSFWGVQGPFFKKVPASFTPILLIRRCTPPCMSARRISPSRENVSKILCISRRYSEYPVSVSFGEYDEDSTRAVQPRRS